MADTPTVFVVDDEASVRDALALFLDAEGLSVKTYNSAQSFLAEYRSNFHGCMIVDIRMPGMSGLELQQVLKRRLIYRLYFLLDMAMSRCPPRPSRLAP